MTIARGNTTHTKRPVRKVGFYGCNRRVVRVECLARKTKYPQVVSVDCPACSHTHDAKPFWRLYMSKLDRGKDAVFV